MLSYRHGFHAGNHADVIKHLTVVLCCEHLAKKDKPFWYVDTHAGAGMYDLNSEMSRKNEEHLQGVFALLQDPKCPEVFADYLRLVKASRDTVRQAYPGSPWFAAQMMRRSDHLDLYELHPADQKRLEQVFERDRRAKVHKKDGYLCLKTVFPPPPRRALVLIDPPYEQEREYQSVLQSLSDGIGRFSTGVYIVWYPLIQRPGSPKNKSSEKLVKQIKTRFSQEQLHVQLIMNKDQEGMYGSGLAIINPPWGLKEQLESALKYICSLDKSGVRTFSVQ
ncbi:MAG: 23S rRNA (adenine(2030)-N(6))-methyltransferase RlmJ [Hahellaceae bacterium]|nr:23S rRNA (adenine(2030)-N(6))-methyltransferase RlmJ [Hahellaceae bacterium]MCP5211506.1 23S rRNA (adenine(2030)-N(6))-methyltransferase RlmJ [Hahellaceae bacterium]